MNSGSLPSIWKDDIIVPIFKKGDTSQTANYRSISIICNISRVFERIISAQLICYLNSKNLVSKNQFGFLKKKNCKIAIIGISCFLVLGTN